jgi:hypothetical protein
LSIARRSCGELDFVVETIVGANTAPHLIEARDQDIARTGAIGRTNDTALL